MNSHQKRKERRQKEREATKLNFSVSHNPTMKGEYELNRQAERILNEQLEERASYWYPKIHIVNLPWHKRWLQNIYCYFGDFHCRHCFDAAEETCCNCGNQMPINFESWKYHQRRRTQ